MSVKIRLRRMGKKKQPHYRIVVADSRSPRDGRFVEILGYYNPITRPARLKVDLERVDYWLDEGAIASPTVDSLVAKARIGGDGKVALAGALAGGEADEAAAEAASAPEAAPEAETVAEVAAEAASEAASEAEATPEVEAASETEAEAAETGDDAEADAPDSETGDAEASDGDAAE